MIDTLKSLLAGQPQIIARGKRGDIIPGYLDGGRALTQGTLRILGVDKASAILNLEHLKGVFFVRDFVGNRHYLEQKTLASDPARPGLRTRLRFEDNETLEGVTENSLDLIAMPGFFFWPGDPRSNNRLIYVVKSALLGFRIMGIKDH